MSAAPLSSGSAKINQKIAMILIVVTLKLFANPFNGYLPKYIVFAPFKLST